MNQYKIDYNSYGMDHPFTLYGKLRWFNKWQHIASFKTKDEARTAFKKIYGLPEYLTDLDGVAKNG